MTTSNKKHDRVTSSNLDSIIRNLHTELGEPVIRLSVLERNTPVNIGSSGSGSGNGKGTRSRSIDNTGSSSEQTTSSSGKENVLLMNNGWNDKNEKILISIGENSASYKWLHDASGSLYSTISKAMSIALILITTSMTSITIVPSGTIAIGIFNQVCTYIITIISILQRFLKYEQRATMHYTQSKEFERLYHDIQQKMSLYRKERGKAVSTMSKTLKVYDDLILNSPSISNYIVNKFKTTFKDANISIPIVAGNIDKIEAVDERVIDVEHTGAQPVLTKLNVINSCVNEYTDKDIEVMDKEKIDHLNDIYLKSVMNHELSRLMSS